MTKPINKSWNDWTDGWEYRLRMMWGWASGDLTLIDVHTVFYFLQTILYYFPITCLPFRIVHDLNQSAYYCIFSTKAGMHWISTLVRHWFLTLSAALIELGLWDNSASDSVSSLNFSVWFELTSCKYENSSSITFFSLYWLPRKQRKPVD